MRTTSADRGRTPASAPVLFVIDDDPGAAHALRDDLVRRFWPESGEAQALTNLRRELHQLRQVLGDDGAASRVAADATAFPYRDGGWAGVIVGVDPDPANAGLITRWAQDYWRDLHPTAAGGGYVNFQMDEGQDRVRDSYRGNYDRLARVKGRYDPDNAFRINQNIQPSR
jgi:hypothetical protein